jgi:hypothetical protein
MPSKPKKMGRPPIYTPELGEEICREIASGKSLRTVCEQKKMGMETVFRWLRPSEPNPEFREHYARACTDRGHALVEDALKISDAPVPRGKDGRMDNAAVQQARLRVDTRKWFASKLVPKIYGDRVQAEVSGPEGGPVAIELTPVDWGKLIQKVTGAPESVPADPEGESEGQSLP